MYRAQKHRIVIASMLAFICGAGAFSFLTRSGPNTTTAPPVRASRDRHTAGTATVPETATHTRSPRRRTNTAVLPPKKARTRGDEHHLGGRKQRRVAPDRTSKKRVHTAA